MVLRPKQYKTNQCFAIPVHMVSQILRLHPGSHGNMNHVLMFWPVSALCTVNYFFYDCATHLFFYVYLYLECFYALFYHTFVLLSLSRGFLFPHPGFDNSLVSLVYWLCIISEFRHLGIFILFLLTTLYALSVVQYPFTGVLKNMLESMGRGLTRLFFLGVPKFKSRQNCTT